MRVLVTGATGYVGSAIVKHLSSDYDVRGLARRDCLLTDSTAVGNHFAKYQDEPFDFLINCAVTGGSRHEVDDAVVTHENLLMFSNLMEWKGHAFHSIINIGSGAEYDRRYSIRPDARQINRRIPVDPYGMSKFYIDRFIQTEPNAYNLRIFSVFDENELERRFIKTALRNYIDDQPIRLARNGDLEMDFIYMEDFIYMVRQVLDSCQPAGVKAFDCVYKSYNFPGESADSKSMSNIARFHIGSLEPGKPARIELDPKLVPSFAGAYVGTPPDWIDESRLVGLKEGIRRTYEKLQAKLDNGDG